MKVMGPILALEGTQPPACSSATRVSNCSPILRIALRPRNCRFSNMFQVAPARRLEHGRSHCQQVVNSRFVRFAAMHLLEVVELVLDLTNVLSDRPKIGGRSTAQSSARLRYSQESEVVSSIPKKVKL